MKVFPTEFLPLKKYDQFMLTDIKNKVPLNPRTYKSANCLDPVNWGSLDEVLNLIKEGVYGVTFVLTESDPFFFIDIDNCFNDTDRWSKLSKVIVDQFLSSCMELSQSGTGLHIISMGMVLPRSYRNLKLGLELHSKNRCLFLTGKQVTGKINYCRPETLNSFVETYFTLNKKV